jgi:hypothetical protein
MLLEDAQDTRDGKDIVRDPVPGTGELMFRGTLHHFFGERESGKSTAVIAAGLSAAVHGEKVLYLDRENGAALTKGKVADALEANDWPDVLEDGRFVGRHYPEMRAGWQGAAFAEAIAGLGFTGVIYDSVREVAAQLGADTDSETDYSRLLNLLVTPLLQRDLWAVLLDNVGHVEKGRPKGSASKLDAAPMGYLVEKVEPFSPVLQGRIRLTCMRSRFGDTGREWSMAVGDGAFAVPAALTESPDAQRARHARDAENTFRAAVVAVLREAHPLGRDLLIAAARKKGAKGRNEKLRNRLAAMAADPTSGVVKQRRRIRPRRRGLGPRSGPLTQLWPRNRGHPGVTGRRPHPGPPDPSLKGGPGGRGHGPRGTRGHGSRRGPRRGLLKRHEDIAGGEHERGNGWQPTEAGCPVAARHPFPDQPRRGEAMSAPCTVCAGPTIRSDDGTRICLNASCPGDVTEHRQLDLIHRSLTEGRSNREDSGSEDNRPGPESAGQGKEEGSRRRRAPRGRRQRNRRGRS